MSASRTNWTEQVIFIKEDEIIRDFVLVKGLKKWTKICKALKSQLGIDGRTGKQCRERWQNHLDPNVKKEDFTTEEENKIFELQEQMGNKWSEIANFIEGRTENAVKNCFYSSVRRNLRKYNKKKPESQKLKGSVKSLLKKPAYKAILLNKKPQESVNVKQKTGNTGKKSLKIEKKPHDIVCPSISPMPNMRYFSFPLTPSTTQSIMSSKYEAGFFNFNEKTEDYQRGGYEKTEDDKKTELSFSESTTPRYFLPNFSPKTTFQHYITPRDSFTKQ